MKGSTLAKNGETSTRRSSASRARRSRRPVARSPGRGLPPDAPLAAARRQGNPAQEPESDLLPDQRRRTRGRAGGGRGAPPRRLRLVLSLLSRPRAVPRPRHDAARDAARRRRGQGRSQLRRAADAVALGAPRAQHPVAEQPHRHAVPAGRRLRRGRHALRAHLRHRRRGRAAARRRDHLHVGRRRRHQRRRVLGVAEHHLLAAGPDALPGRGQRLRDLGPGRGPDARRRHLAAGRELPQPQGAALRRHRLPRELPRARRRRGLGAAGAQAGVRARPGDPPVLAFALGRRAALQDAAGARGGGPARPAGPDARVPAR